MDLSEEQGRAYPGAESMSKCTDQAQEMLFGVLRLWGVRNRSLTAANTPKHQNNDAKQAKLLEKMSGSLLWDRIQWEVSFQGAFSPDSPVVP